MEKDKKTIGIIVRFFTNDLPQKIGGKNNQIPFWTSGNVHLEANKEKGITSQDEIFHYIDDVPRAIREVMSRSKLVAVEDVAYSLRAHKRHNRVEIKKQK